MGGRLEGKRVAFLVANEGIEQAELSEPWKAVTDAGGAPELIAPEAGEVQAFNHLDPADRFPVDRTTADATGGEYDALVLPGGVANADEIRTDDDAVRLVREIVDANRPIAVICHGPWILIEADAVRGRTMTSFPSVRTDLRNAGAQWVDEEVHVDRGLVSSRTPDDLPAFCAKLVEEFAEGEHEPRPEAGAPLAV
jgi:protease I